MPMAVTRAQRSSNRRAPLIVSVWVLLFSATLLCACSDGPNEIEHISGAQPLAVDKEAGARPRHNILLILVDDLGFNDLAINNGNRDIDTPRLDALAREGVRYTRHYATAVCSPARAALLTGQNPTRLGFQPDGPGISPEVITLPERLREAGYVTWHLGKWHAGDLHRGAWPDRQGFDHWLGFLNQWRLAGRGEGDNIQLARPRYKDPWLQGDSEPGRHFPGHLETILTAKAVEVLSELNGGSQPWFLNLWFYAPHSPIRPAPEFASRYPNTPAGRYRAHVNQLDHNIGVILDHMDRIGASKNTIVVVASDNGGTNRQLDNNAPYSGHKDELTEGGLRTPLLVRWPEGKMAGQVVDDIVAIQDIYPTLLDALGLEAPAPIDGHSFYPGRGGSHPHHERALFWEQGLGQSMLSADGRWRLHQANKGYGIDLPTELFDLERSPSGGSATATPPPAVLEAMQAEFEAWYREVHIVPTTLEVSKDGSRALVGASFQRTPGIGGYAIALGIDGDSQGQLLHQAGTWLLSRSDRRIVAQFGDHQLAGEIPDPAACHSVIISGIFYRHISSFADVDRLDLNLYIDGSLAGQLQVEGAVPAAEPTAPTNLGRGVTVNARSPMIFNIPLESSPFFTLESLDKALCERA